MTLDGTITDIDVTFTDLWHDAFGPADLDVMVVSPYRTGVMLMSDGAGAGPTIGNSASPDYPTPNTSLLSTFDGKNPNRTSSLYLMDDWPTDPCP